MRNVRVDNYLICVALGPRFETDCEYRNVTVGQFYSWLKGEITAGPLDEFSPHTHTCYIDYKYMKDMFLNHPEVLEQGVFERCLIVCVKLIQKIHGVSIAVALKCINNL